MKSAVSEEGFGVGVASAEIAIDFERVATAALSEDGVAETAADFADGGGIFQTGFLERTRSSHPAVAAVRVDEMAHDIHDMKAVAMLADNLATGSWNLASQ